MSNFLIAPDFSPMNFGGWHMFNTLLQRRSGNSLHLIIPQSHAGQFDALANESISLIYANPFDAARLIREQGFRPLVRPINKSDEMVIVSSIESDINTMDDIPSNPSVAMADNRDVKLIGLRLLESVDISESDIDFNITKNYQAAARCLIQGNTDLVFFMSEVYSDLSRLTKSQFSVLIESDLAEISHVVLAHKDYTHADELRDIMLSLQNDKDGLSVLKELGIPQGFETLHEEDAEFMIDLMDTLLD